MLPEPPPAAEPPVPDVPDWPALPAFPPLPACTDVLGEDLLQPKMNETASAAAANPVKALVRVMTSLLKPLWVK
jgi:hypothetical protein